MNNFMELLGAYRELFNEAFPYYAFRGMPESEIIKIIKNCIEENKPCVPEYKEGAIY